VHLIGNMWMLRVFGDDLEDKLTQVAVPALLSDRRIVLRARPRDHEPRVRSVPTLDASGAIAAVMGAYFRFIPGARNPGADVIPLFPPRRVPVVVCFQLSPLVQCCSSFYGIGQPRRGPEDGAASRGGAAHSVDSRSDSRRRRSAWRPPVESGAATGAMTSRVRLDPFELVERAPRCQRGSPPDRARCRGSAARSAPSRSIRNVATVCSISPEGWRIDPTSVARARRRDHATGADVRRRRRSAKTTQALRCRTGARDGVPAQHRRGVAPRGNRAGIETSLQRAALRCGQPRSSLHLLWMPVRIGHGPGAARVTKSSQHRPSARSRREPDTVRSSWRSAPKFGRGKCAARASASSLATAARTPPASRAHATRTISKRSTRWQDPELDVLAGARPASRRRGRRRAEAHRHCWAHQARPGRRPCLESSPWRSSTRSCRARSAAGCVRCRPCPHASSASACLTRRAMQFRFPAARVYQAHAASDSPLDAPLPPQQRDRHERPQAIGIATRGPARHIAGEHARLEVRAVEAREPSRRMRASWRSTAPGPSGNGKPPFLAPPDQPRSAAPSSHRLAQEPLHPAGRGSGARTGQRERERVDDAIVQRVGRAQL
jgi:hypothetical protein